MEKNDLHSTLQRIKNTKESIIESTTDNNTRAAEKMINQDISKRGCRVFNVGEEVLVRKEPHYRRKDGMQYEGPFKIVKFITDHQVQLYDGKNNKLRRIEWLKRYNVN